MRGTRYGDFSRVTFDPRHPYDAVLQQQGRVQLDADANEQAMLGQHRIERAIADLMGGSAAPAGAPGYAVRPRHRLGFDGGGAIEVEDAELLLAETGWAFTLELAITWDGGAGTLVDAGAWRLGLDGDGRLTLALLGDDGSALLIAEERLERGRLELIAVVVGDGFAALSREARTIARTTTETGAGAPGGRLLLGAAGGGEQPEDGFRGLLGDVRLWSGARSPAQLATGRHAAPAGDDLRAWWPLDAAGGTGDARALDDRHGGRAARLVGEAPPAWRLSDLEVGAGRYYVDGVACEQREARALDAPPDADGRHLVYLEVWEDTVAAVQDPSLREVALGGADTSVRTQTVSAVRHLALDEDDDPCEHDHGRRRDTSGTMSAHHAGALVPGNFLYRVEVHTGGHVGEHHHHHHHDGHALPTLKWSRRNGADVWAIAPVAAGADTVALLAGGPIPDALRPGDVVELLDDRVTLDGPAPALHVVEHADVAQGTLTISPKVHGAVGRSAERHPFLRLWHRRPDGAGDEDPAIALRADADVELEDGIAVRFAPGRYRRGDYWWIVARQELGGIEWPLIDGRPVARAPDGVERRRAPLALITLDEDGADVRDLRRIAGAVVTRPAEDDAREEDGGDEVVADDDAGAAGEDGEPARKTDDGGVPEDEAWPDGEGGDDVGDGDASAEASRWGRAGAPRAPAWDPPVALDLPDEALVGLATLGDGLVAATTSALWRIDPESGATERLAALPRARDHFALCAVDPVVLLVGGRPLDGKEPDGQLLVCDLQNGTWRTESDDMPRPVDRAAAVVFAGLLHVFGGATSRRPGNDPTAAYQVYDPGSGAWTRGPDLPSARSAPVALVVDERLHLIGGRHRSLFHISDVARHDALDADRHAWVAHHELPKGRVARAGAHGDGGHALLHVAHDAGAPGLMSYNSDDERWEPLGEAPAAVGDPRVAAHRDGFALVGRDARGGHALQVLRR